jgi:2-polyprenyl-6-hydroxyphenyl methylase/3-demethylubiquinone-9 3-methyltransferase
VATSGKLLRTHPTAVHHNPGTNDDSRVSSYRTLVSPADYRAQLTDPVGAYPYVMPTLLELAGELQAGARILDIGCGGGYLVGRLAEMGFTVVGVEPNPDRVAVAASAYPAARFEQLPAAPDLLEQLGEQPFDLVVSTEVLEHLYAPEGLVVGAFRALKPGRKLILSTPYHGYLKNLVIAVSGRCDAHHQPLYTGGHIKFFSRRSLSQLLETAGFENLIFRGAGRLPGLWKSSVVSATRPLP